MLDRHLKPHTAALMQPIVCCTPSFVTPNMLSILGLVLGLGGALAVAGGRTGWGLGLWLISRLADGVDGLLARTRNSCTASGAYLDFMADMVVYTSMILGLAYYTGHWAAAAILIATFSLNIVSWMMPMMLTGATSSKPGLIEGAETIAFLTAMIVFVQLCTVLMTVLAVAIVVGAAIRFWSTWLELR